MEPGFRWRKKYTVRIIEQSFIGSEYAQHTVNLVVIGLHILISDRPVISQSVEAFSFKIKGAKTQRNPSPVIGSSAEHTCPPPFPLCIPYMSVRFSVNFPAPVTAVEITEWPELRTRTSSGRFPGIF